MFYAIDKITGEIILSINIRSENYKNTYNKSLRFICGGCIDNGEKCNDNNVSFVNSKVKQPHFRHSKNTECSASKEFKEFNIDFYKNWFDLFKKQYRKPYWFNVNLEQIKYDNYVIMIRYSHQTEKIIKNIEKYVKEDNKIIWILSLENRKYDKIIFHKGKFYIDFIGNKNDIPLYDNNKSIIYLDTGYDVLLKVKLESYNNKGQEIEIVYIKDLCKEYDELFILYPYRKKWGKMRELEEEIIIINDNIKKNQKYYYELTDYYFHNFKKNWFSIDKKYDILIKINETYNMLCKLLNYEIYSKGTYWIIGEEMTSIKFSNLIKKYNKYTYLFIRYGDILKDLKKIHYYYDDNENNNGKYEIKYEKTEYTKNTGHDTDNYNKTFITFEGCKMFIYLKLNIVGLNFNSNYYTEVRFNKIEIYYNKKMIKKFETNENFIGNKWFNEYL
jgi:hypothetical protein